MNTILNGNGSKSQDVGAVNSYINKPDEQSLLDGLSSLLFTRDKKDLLTINYILNINFYENRPVRIEEIMTLLSMSNPSCSVRLRKLRETKIPSTEYPILQKIKSGNAFLHSFTEAIPLDKALNKVTEIIQKIGIDIDSELNKGTSESIPQENSTENSLQGMEESTDKNYVSTTSFSSDSINSSTDENSNYKENENASAEGNTKTHQSENNIKLRTNENIEECFEKQDINNDDILDEPITIREALAMIDEASNRIIHEVSKTFSEILSEEYTKLDNKIVELEKKITSQSATQKKESKEELEARVRNLVKQRFSSR